MQLKCKKYAMHLSQLKHKKYAAKIKNMQVFIQQKLTKISYLNSNLMQIFIIFHIIFIFSNIILLFILKHLLC